MSKDVKDVETVDTVEGGAKRLSIDEEDPDKGFRTWGW
jgi:hypothetical protein